jgi:hypothetical protein
LKAEAVTLPDFILWIVYPGAFTAIVAVAGILAAKYWIK